MSAALDVFASDFASQENDTMTANVIPSVPDNAATRLQDRTLAVKVAFTWFGQRKALSDDLKEAMTLGFGTQAKAISASKRLFANHPALKALSKIKGEIRKYWQDQTLPFPEDGKRLLPKNSVAEFRYRMETFSAALQSAVNDLNFSLYDVKRAAQEELGSLYDESDYPSDFNGKFAVEWSFSDVSVPSYLMTLDPQAYEQEREKIARQFERAIQDSEQEFAAQFADLVDHICERLTPNPDGTQKIFRDSTVNNLLAFFERFRSLNTGSNDRLDALVEQAKQAIQYKSAGAVRESQSLRDNLKTRLEAVSTSLDAMLIDRPKRRIIRETAPVASETPETPASNPSEESAESAA